MAPTTARGGAAERRYAIAMALVALVALVIRLSLLTSIAERDPGAPSDPDFYHRQANMLVEGHGFPDPYLYDDTGRYEPVAIHPPLFTIWLAIPSALGFKSMLAHKVMSCFAGVLAVVAIGVLGRAVAGRRAGILAALLAAVYPPLWSIDGQLWPEGLFAAMVALTAWAGVRAWKDPGPRWAAVTGGFLGLAALTRGEGIILAVAMVAPLLLLRGRDHRSNLRDLAVAAVACAVVVSPWTVRNVVKFEEFVPISTNSDELLVYANNPYAYGTVEGGRFLGFWYYPWQQELRDRLYGGEEPPGDASQRAKVWGEHGREYAADNLDRLPVVAAARLGRAWNLYAPFQNAEFDKIDGKSERVSIVGTFAWWGVLALSLPALAILRRRRMTIVPFVGLAATVSISAVYAYGGNRFRTPLDLAAVVLASVTLVATYDAWRSRREAPA
jgi:4-amino-4-deoxy-L-arabinose transferase-like glycosyltransferase